MALNIPILSGGSSTEHCNTGGLMDISAPIVGSQKRSEEDKSWLGGHGNTVLNLSLPFLSGGKSTQKCETGDLIESSLLILSD